MDFFYLKTVCNHREVMIYEGKIAYRENTKL